MRGVHDETSDENERFRLDVLDDKRVGPAGGAAVDVSDDKLLILASQDSRQTVGRIRLGQVVAELRRQSCNLARIRQAGKPNRDKCHGHSSDM